MTPMTFKQWCADQMRPDGAPAAHEIDPETQLRRYRAYLDGVSFIRSQIGAFPVTPIVPSHRSYP